MKICYFDAFCGISGDMSVGALVDAGADWAAIEGSLQSLGLGASFRLERVKRKGIAAVKFRVDAPPQKTHRHLSHIEKVIHAAALSETARGRALGVFRRLADAEAKSHDVPVERVHFHEVGAVDSISDIVGACVALDLLGIDEVRASRVNVGSGTVATEHGVLPVPAPATAELLKECPVYSAGPETELTTPTGAALLATFAAGFGPVPAMRVCAQGFGAGDKDFAEQANVLRVLIGERTGAAESTLVTVLEANIDDSTPQMLGYAMERLFEAGALDVTFAPIFMKKNRPATMISALAPPELAEQLIAILMAETTTLGVRVLQAERRVLARDIAEVETGFGKIRVKYTDAGSFAPEYEDCRKAAREHGRPLREVMEAARAAFRRVPDL
jgi:uncharacterized protein (TIGR00299 family) protein